MSAFKGTPGPWTTDEREHDAPNQNIRVRSGWRGICEVWIDDAPVPDYNAEQRANARLIAAAPELLEALMQMVERISYYAELKEEGIPNIEDWAYTYNSGDMQRARAAIQKATGGDA